MHNPSTAARRTRHTTGLRSEGRVQVSSDHVPGSRPSEEADQDLPLPAAHPSQQGESTSLRAGSTPTFRVPTWSHLGFLDWTQSTQTRLYCSDQRRNGRKQLTQRTLQTRWTLRTGRNTRSNICAAPSAFSSIPPRLNLLLQLCTERTPLNLPLQHSVHLCFDLIPTGSAAASMCQPRLIERLRHCF